MESVHRLHREVNRLQRRLWRRRRYQVDALVGSVPTALRRYERAYRAALQGPARPSELGAVIERAARADIVLVGDYHTYQPCQATCGQLLDALVERRRPAVLLVELAQVEHQRYLDRYLAGAIDERELLRRLDYGNTWGFRWDGYRGLLELARRHGLAVLGLNGPHGDATLAERDRWAAAQLLRAAETAPDAVPVALIGDMHLADPHLPRAIAARWPTRPDVVRVFQDSDPLYWRLSQPQPSAVIELAADTYCVFNGTPWQKLDSYLSWLESDAHAFAAGDGDADVSDRALELAEALAEFLRLRFRPDAARTIYTPADPVALDELVEHASDSQRWALMNDVLVLPGSDRLYLSNPDMLHIAAAAAELVLDQAMPLGPADLAAGTGGLLRRIYRRALSYMGAKLLAPVRRPSLAAIDDVRARHLVAGHAVTSHCTLADDPFVELRLGPAAEDDLRLGLLVSSAVGRTVGEGLFEALMAGRLKIGGLRPWFQSMPPPAELRARLRSCIRTHETRPRRAELW